MRMPKKEDDLLIQTFRIGASTDVLTKLEQQLYSRASEKKDAEECFALALFYCVLISYITDGQKQHKYLMDTIEWSSQTIEKDEEHWSALFLRAMVRLMMDAKEEDEMAMYLLPMDYTEEDVTDDLYRMIDLQKSLSEPSPYCIIPYIQLAYAKVIDNDLEGALTILKNSGENIKFEELPHFRDVLRLPFVILYKKAYELHNYEMLRLIKNLIVTFLPELNFNVKGKK